MRRRQLRKESLEGRRTGTGAGADDGAAASVIHGPRSRRPLLLLHFGDADDSCPDADAAEAVTARARGLEDGDEDRLACRSCSRRPGTWLPVVVGVWRPVDAGYRSSTRSEGSLDVLPDTCARTMTVSLTTGVAFDGGTMHRWRLRRQHRDAGRDRFAEAARVDGRGGDGERTGLLVDMRHRRRGADRAERL